MGSKRRAPSSAEETEVQSQKMVTPEDSGPLESVQDIALKKNIKPMERRKKRKGLDKERNHSEAISNSEVKKPAECPPVKEAPFHSSSISSSSPGFHINVFKDLASADLLVRKAAAEKLVVELIEVQRAYEKVGGEKGKEEEGEVQLEAEKDDGLDNCAPSLRYAIRRLIRGVSSSRECARQGFALGLSIVVAKIPTIKVEPLMKSIVNLLEVSASMKGQEAKDCFLGRLFAYGALARSGRLAAEFFEDNNTSSVTDFVSNVMSLAGKKRYLREPVMTIILHVVEKLPFEAVMNHVLEVPAIKECFQKAANMGDPDALFLALKLQERVPIESEMPGMLLPSPFSPDTFFTRDHLSNLVHCFKESTFCHPRVHSLWQLLVNMLVHPLTSQGEVAACVHSTKKHKKSRKGGSCEEMAKNVRCFCEVVIEETLLLSSHERKHLALMVLLLLLPRLPASFLPCVLSYKLVQCLMDILPTKGSHLHETALYFMKELVNWIGNDDDRRVAVIIALQKHSSGRFDCVTKTHTVKGLVAKLVTGQGCLIFVHNIMSLFVEDGILADEPSDQSQTTDENSEICSVDGKDVPEESGNTDRLKSWIVDTMPRVLKNLKLDSNAKSWADTEIVKFLEERFRVQAEIMKFLAVQGLFSASLGTEVTSFELQEKFKWPKAVISSSLCRMCIEQLQLLLEDAQRGEVSNATSSSLERNDLGSYFMCFLKTLCNIPSVSLYRALSEKDQEAFKKLQETESRLLPEERNLGSGLEANKLHALRCVIIQLVLQVLLCPDEFYEAASELVICCEKASPAAAAAASSDNSGEVNEFDDNETPDLMDVLLETFLSLLPHSSGPMCFAIEQAFRLFCDDLTIDGILRMLHVVRKDLKPLRYHTYSSDDDDDGVDEDEDDDFLGIEDLDETSKAEDVVAGEGDDHANPGRLLGSGETGDKLTKNEEVDSGGVLGGDASSDDEVNQNLSDHSASDDSDGDMDDDAMLMKDAAIVDILKQRLSTEKDGASSLLLTFKSRVLTLLEIFLQKHPGKSQVLMIYSYLVRAFVKYHSAQKPQLQQLALRIRGILQKKIFKAKDYPKGDDIPLASLEPLLEKSLRSASRYPDKEVSSLAQASTFWLLKVIQSRNCDKSELKTVVDLFQSTLVDYFESKKCRLKSGFVKEVIRRHPWVGHELFGFLLEKCAVAKSEFRRIEALEVVDCVMKSGTPVKGKDGSGKLSAKLLKKHMPALCDLIQVLLSQLPEKQSRRAEVRRFCTRALNVISALDLRKPFLKVLKPEARSLCESHLGNVFLPFKTPSP
ncbi:DNA polymerase V-like [Asparagus officinalis]|uniref:DNA polymerase V-like n=1 Tax=Asparagus officinalis TaxID=4686 RepID=UPI00098E4F80|nr:DNA polymerase V-like [Asparagus officinalis]XP_020253657.1 DNA polymerase V-like [Asparagus officinalis]XP_020253658.1 DNA polymerase V-like [Asparagus officinalis]XP_020253659.1 DNA polymerase V-like [Asparagus officinalis]